MTQRKHTAIEGQMATIAAAERALSAGCAQTRNLLVQHDSDVRVLMLKPQIVANLNDLSKNETAAAIVADGISGLPDIQADMLFAPDNKMSDAIAQSAGGAVMSASASAAHSFIVEANEVKLPRTHFLLIEEQVPYHPSRQHPSPLSRCG
jgi:hypothetical protein